MNTLPSVLISIIHDYLSGNLTSWKVKYKPVLNNIIYSTKCLFCRRWNLNIFNFHADGIGLFKFNIDTLCPSCFHIYNSCDPICSCDLHMYCRDLRDLNCMHEDDSEIPDERGIAKLRREYYSRYFP